LQNRSFQVGISAAGTGTLNQQNLVTLYNASFTSGVGSAAPAQASTGACSTGSYWDLGVRGDTGPTNHTGGMLTPMWSVISSGSGYPGNNSNAAPPVVHQFCNGSRVPPECSAANGCGGPKGFGVPPGISDAVTPNPVFSLNPSATVDEGNNWINVSWGPLALTNPSVLGPPPSGATGGNYGGGPALANYNLTAAIDSIPGAQPHPSTDFYGNARPEPNEGNPSRFDPGAIEFGSSPPVVIVSATLTPTTWSPTATRGCSFFVCPVQVFTLTNTGNVPLTGITSAILTTPGTATEFSIVAFLTTCGPGAGQLVHVTTLAPGATCVVTGRFAPPAGDTASPPAKTRTLSITDLAGTQTSSLSGTAN